MSFLPNGRPATQSDLAGLRAHLDLRFDSFERRFDDMDARVRAVEQDDARDDGAEAAQATKRVVEQEAGISRRWRIGIAMGIVVAISGNLISILKP